MTDVLSTLAGKLDAAAKPAIAAPPAHTTLYHWLHEYAQVRVGNAYRPYSTSGREPLYATILTIDHVLGNDVSYADEPTRLAILDTTQYGRVIKGAQIDVCGGAQFGKTILALLLKTYLGTVKFYGCMYCLPDDDLVQGIIDTKERPDVIDQIPYVSSMLVQGKDLTPSGKAVNRKGAMLYTDGQKTAISMMRGLGKFPTTFTCDCVIIDERDDVKEIYADYLPGRMTTSDLQLTLNIGTQRWAGAGQNALFEEGSRHVGHLHCPGCARDIVPEESWPEIVRLSVTGRGSPADPKMNDAGSFTGQGGETVAYNPKYSYYFGCPHCGAALDRTQVRYAARAPESITLRRWSIRVSQMACSGLPVDSFVHDWCTAAVKKKAKRAAFACDRLAIPQATDQELSPAILNRAETLEPYGLDVSPIWSHCHIGIDTGDQCYLTARSTGPDRYDRIVRAEQCADSDCEARAVALFSLLEADCVFIDAGPLRDLSRRLALRLNGTDLIPIATIPEWEHSLIRYPSGVEWDGRAGIWRNLRCAPVEFTGKPGSGIQQQARLTPDNLHIYPVISCNRDEAIQALIDDFKTSHDGVAEIDPATGKLRDWPRLLVPSREKDSSGAAETLRKHILAGSKKAPDANGRESHYVDGIANHYLLSAVYGRLAKMYHNAGTVRPEPLAPRSFTHNRRAQTLAGRRNREVLA